MSTPDLLDWPAALAAGTAAAGGKGWQLARLARYGLPVPDGLVVPAAWQQRAQCGDVSAVMAELSAQLRDALSARNWLDVPLAVRSSAVAEDGASASFAGLHDSQLNVCGLGELCRAITSIWASLHSPQAVAYRQRLGLPAGDAGMAVVLMPMLPAVAAGVAFTCDPETGRHDRLRIAANWGLGSSVVNGSSDVDEYIYALDMLDEQLTPLATRIGQKQQTVRAALQGVVEQTLSAEMSQARVLAPEHAQQLAELALDAARALDFARPLYDLEWVWDGQRFWLLQARPVTALPRHGHEALKSQPLWWSDGNARDVVPLPLSALEWSGVRSQVERVTTQYATRAGYPVLPGLERARMFAGRVYVNMAACQFEYFDAFGISPAEFNKQLGGHQPEIRVNKPGVRQRLIWAWRWMRLLRVLPRLRKQVPALEARILQRAEELQDSPLPECDSAAISALREMRRYAFTQDDLCCLQMPGATSAMVRELLVKQMPADADAVAATLLAVGTPSVTAQQSHELVVLAKLASRFPEVVSWLQQDRRDEVCLQFPSGHEFREAFAAFLSRYGHRAVYESYLRSPRWSEEPGYLLDRLAVLLEIDSEAQQRQREAQQSAAQNRVRDVLPAWRRVQLKILLNLAREENNQRELARSCLIRLLAVGRHHYLQIAKRLSARSLLTQADDIFELTPGEIEAAMLGRIGAAGLKARIQDRKAERAHWAQITLPDVVSEEGCLAVAAVPPNDGSDSLKGLPIAAGVATGPARVLRHPDEAEKLQPGDILVCPSTDPAWTLLFLQAGGLVMETGGYLSHGAIVARELGIPAVANVPSALRRIRDGQRLRVDGGTGLIHL